MRREDNAPISTSGNISLRIATIDDAPEIWKQDAILFNKEVEYSDELASEILEPAENTITYLILHNGEVIGKIKVDYNEDTAFIFGFGIMPEYRGNGYGREALKETLNLIIDKGIFISELDVECNNDRALNLYKSCGFEEVSSMNYYEYKMDE